MQFKQGVGVRTAGGQSIGQLDGVVVDPRTKEVNYIVVRKGAFFSTDKVVPLTLVARAGDDGIVLREDAGDLEQLPQFEERYYVPANEERTSTAVDNAGVTPSLYPYPPVVGGEMAGLGNVNTQASMGGLTSRAPLIEHTERAIPDNNVAIRPGESVVSADGKHVGSVEQVLTGEYADQVTHFIISQGLVFKDRKLVPVGWVAEIGEDEVRLAVDAAFLNKLEGYNPPG